MPDQSAQALAGASILIQTLIVRALHDAQVIDKQRIIDLASQMSAELGTYPEAEAAGFKAGIDTFIQALDDTVAPSSSLDPALPGWFRGVVSGGKLS